jgi:hypothetical protein
MWEHGMPGIAWSMAADLARWEELGDDTDDDRALATSQETTEADEPVGQTRQRRPGNWWRRRRFEAITLTGTVIRSSEMGL